jgi:colicin import membrane protein
MSTIAEPQTTSTPPGDPHFYGWREVSRTTPEGKPFLEQIPLTLEDTLHPQLGDHVVEGPMHDQYRMYLAGVFRERLADDPTAWVLSDCGVYWDHPEHTYHAPDIAVLTGLHEPEGILRRDSYSVAEWGEKPFLIVEIVSRHIRSNDVEKKFEAYHELGVPFYIILDRVDSDDDWTVVGYEHTPRRYLKMATDERGRLWLGKLGVWLGVQNNKIVCWDGENERPIGDYVAVSQQLVEAEARAEAATQRAEAEASRAEAEKARAEAAEAKLREMEAELAKLREPKTP